MKLFIPILIISWAAISKCSTFKNIEDVFGDSMCISGAVHYLPSGANLVKSEEGYSYAPITREDIEHEVEEASFQKYQHPVALVHEIAMLNKITYKFYLENEEGEPHQKIFTIKLKLGDEEYIGTGKSLKEGRMNAALEAITSTIYAIPEKKVKNNEDFPPMVELHNLANEKGLKLTYTFITKEEFESGNGVIFGFHDVMNSGRKLPIRTFYNSSTLLKHLNNSQISKKNILEKHTYFYVRLLVDDRQYYGKGFNKATAKNDATLKALEDLHENPFDELDHEELMKKRMDNRTPLAKLNEIKSRCNDEFIFEVEETGPAHEKVFAAKLKFMNYETSGEGRKKKEAKHAAAEKMMEILYEEQAHLLIGSSDGNDSKKKKKKKKKAKLIKTSFEKFQDKVEDIVSSASQFIWPTDSSDKDGPDNRPSTDNKGSFKEKLIQLLGAQGIEISFVDGPQNKDLHSSLISAGTIPSYICFGQGVSRKHAEELAAAAMFKNLQRLGFDGLKPDPVFDGKLYSNFKELLSSFHIVLLDEKEDSEKQSYTI